MSRTRLIVSILLIVIGISDAALVLLASHTQTLHDVRRAVIFSADVCRDGVNAGYGFHLVSKEYEYALWLDDIFGYIIEIDYFVYPVEPRGCQQFLLRRYIYEHRPLEHMYYEVLSSNPVSSDVFPNLDLDNKTISLIKAMCPGLKRAVLIISVVFRDSYIVLDPLTRPARIARLQFAYPENVVDLSVPLVINGSKAMLLPQDANYSIDGFFDLEREWIQYIGASRGGCKFFPLHLVEKEHLALRRVKVMPPDALRALHYLVWIVTAESILLIVAGSLLARVNDRGGAKSAS